MQKENTVRPQIRIALAGNPNSGKTTIFNALTGTRQKVGNWPGVTVEKKEGDIERFGRRIRIIDLPGFADDPKLAHDALLSDILREWYEEQSEAS